MSSKVTSIKIAGLGGMGVLTSTQILAEVFFQRGLDVKKAEVHGMSQRGGSVSTDIRFGPRVWSPMATAGEADFLVALDETQIEPNRHMLKSGGVLLHAGLAAQMALPSPKALNVGMLGLLSAFLAIPPAVWMDAVRAALPPKLHALNEQAFAAGRAVGETMRQTL